MADLVCVRAGSQIPERARKAFHERYGLELPTVVGPYTDDQQGQWICVACGCGMRNQIDAHNHADGSPERRNKRAPGGFTGCSQPGFAWRDSTGAVGQGPKEIK
jgi:hypothetical protein